MITLFINTAAEESMVAIFNDDQVVAEKRWFAERQLGADLLPAIDSLLQTSHITPDQLNRIAVYPGPGSFTGTRIGVTTANALAFGLNIPVVTSKHAEFRFDDITYDEIDFTQSVVPRYATPASVTLKKRNRE